MRIPYGYILSAGQLTINEKAADTVHKIFNYYLAVQVLEKLQICFSIAESPLQLEIPNGQGPLLINSFPTQSISHWLDLSFTQMFSLRRSAGAI